MEQKNFILAKLPIRTKPWDKNSKKYGSIINNNQLQKINI